MVHGGSTMWLDRKQRQSERAQSRETRLLYLTSEKGVGMLEFGLLKRATPAFPEDMQSCPGGNHGATVEVA
jgi:hypothetical protein